MSNAGNNKKQTRQDTQFKKGQSGNPSGRPKEAKGHRSILAREMERKITVTENGHTRKMTMWQMTVKQQMMKAAKGDLRAADWMLKNAIRLGLLDSDDTVPDLSDSDREILNAFATILRDPSIEALGEEDAGDGEHPAD